LRLQVFCRSVWRWEVWSCNAQSIEPSTLPRIRRFWRRHPPLHLTSICHHHTPDDKTHINQVGRTCSASAVCTTAHCVIFSVFASRRSKVASASRVGMHYLASLSASPVSDPSSNDRPGRIQSFHRDQVQFAPAITIQELLVSWFQSSASLYRNTSHVFCLKHSLHVPGTTLIQNFFIR
jgi:hypothetical protein